MFLRVSVNSCASSITVGIRHAGSSSDIIDVHLNPVLAKRITSMACLFFLALVMPVIVCAGMKSLHSSGKLAAGPAVDYVSEKIEWQAGMTGHSHYKLEAKKTALFVIDPQKVYSACPKNVASVPELLADPGSKGFDGHSPLCCDKFGPAIANANTLAKQARTLGMPVFVHAHVYRGGATPTNCGRLCDFDVLGWTKWPMAFNLWSEKFPWHALDDTFETEDSDYYAEKTTYSAMTQPVVDKLKELGVDTIIVTGFMTQFCSVTTSRHAHDLGFKVIYVSDANDGPILLELLSGVDENAYIPFTLGVAVADTIDTASLLQRMANSTTLTTTGVTIGTPGPCSAEWEDCRTSRCCGDGLTCYEKDTWYAQCLSTCPDGWSCTVLSNVETTSTAIETPGPCSAAWQDCLTSKCCGGGLTCYEKDTWYAQCLSTCPNGWSCTVLSNVTTTSLQANRRLLQYTSGVIRDSHVSSVASLFRMSSLAICLCLLSF